MRPSPIFFAPDHRLRAGWRFLVSIGVVLVAASLMRLIRRFSPDMHHFGGSTILLLTLLLALLIAGFAVLLHYLDRVRSGLLPAMGLPLDRSALKDTGVGVVFGVTMVSACVGVIAVLGRVRLQAGPVHTGPIAVVLGTALVAAMNEEVVFRGYPFQRLVEAIGAPGAVILLAGLFGAGHLQNPSATIWGALNTVGFGVFMALGYLRTRALWLPWGVHFAWNLGLGLGYGLTVSGLSQFSVVVHGTMVGPRWLTGGDYGIEASATATVGLLVATAALLLFVKPRPAPEIIVGGDEPPRITPGPDQISLGGIQ
ncbi:MAG: CPBP family intramembrane glutamic endopeptidase [Terriglobales bacterium]